VLSVLPPALDKPALAPGPAWSRQLQLFVESTGERIDAIDTDQPCTFHNRAAAAMSGRRPEAVLGLATHALMHHSHADGRHDQLPGSALFPRVQPTQEPLP
jgi:PAS domain-containing protein